MESTIATRAMKFRLSRGGVKKAVRDKEAEEQIKELRGDEGQLVSRKLFQNPTSPIYKYQTKSNEMYQYHVHSTLPYGDDGTRILSNEAYFDYSSTMGAYISTLDGLRYEAVGTPQIYKANVDADIRSRNQKLIMQGKPATASTSDYPDYNTMYNRLYVTWYPEPISTVGDFRFEVPESMRKAFEEQEKINLQTAKRNIKERLEPAMEAFVNKLSVPIGQDGAIFRNTLVTNLTQFIDLLPTLNVDNDPMVNIIAEELKQATAFFADNPDTLRESPNARDVARLNIEQVMEKLGGWKI